MNHKPPLRLICKAELESTDVPSESGAKSSTKEPQKERVVGKSLLSFLTAYADAIDNDIKNILEL